MDTLKQRQKFYFLGKKLEQEGNLIEAYNTYSTHLADEDKHIPHQWISMLYQKLDNKKNRFPI